MTETPTEHDGEWQPLEGTTSITIDVDTTAITEQWERTLTSLRFAVTQMVNAAAPAMRALAKAVAEAQHMDQSQFALAPPRPPATRRPAWQSPYGPPTKGHRR